MTNPFLHLRAIFFSFTGWVDSNVELIWLRVHLAFTDNAHNFTPYERVQRRGHLFVYDVLLCAENYTRRNANWPYRSGTSMDGELRKKDANWASRAAATD